MFQGNPTQRKPSKNHPLADSSEEQDTLGVMTMLNQETINKLKDMKLTGMVEASGNKMLIPPTGK